MLFNSIEFLLFFLPAVLAVSYVLSCHADQRYRRFFIVLATLIFYAFAGIKFLFLLLASVSVNFVAGHVIARSARTAGSNFALLSCAVVLNLLVLGYFKYFNVVIDAVNLLAAADFSVEQIILPLGISFFTFQQIGYLVDVGRGRVRPGGLLDYANFVLFFPQLLAGPIVKYEEVIEQHRCQPDRKKTSLNVLIGLTIFSIGLFKKTVIADSLALYAGPVFVAAGDGSAIGFFDTWLAAFAYTAQVYFDFSGYSDMAIGTARMFGIILPLNFLSPLRSRSVVEIWRRWHVTLGRWVQSYVFQPISLPLARRAAMAGHGAYRTLILSTIIPTMASMLVIGVWHGAGVTFVVFGLLQGIYMSANEWWAAFRRKARKARRKAGIAEPRWHGPVACAATLLAFVFAIIPFGASDGASMIALFGAALGGAGGLVVPDAWPFGLSGCITLVVVAYVLIFVMPNSSEIMGKFEPVLNWCKDWAGMAPSRYQVTWEPNLGWSVLTGAALFFAIAFIMRGTTEFVYFGF